MPRPFTRCPALLAGALVALLLTACPALGQQGDFFEGFPGAIPQETAQSPGRGGIPMFKIPPPASPGRDVTPKTQQVLFNKPLDRTTPSLLLESGAITELRNMRRIAPGVPAGYTRRSGTSVFNATAIASATVKGLYQLVRPDHNIELLFAQCDDELHAATDHPPDTTSTFGTAVYTGIDSGASAAIGEKIGDDLVLAATGTSPWAWSGGTDFPNASYMVHETTDPQVYVDAKDVLKKYRADLNILFLQAGQSGGSVFYVGYHRRLEGISLDFVAGATNILAATTAVSAYQGGSWTPVTSLTDGTADSTGTTPFYENSGRISWTYDADDDPYLLPNTKDHLFWYQVAVNSDVTDGMLLRRVRVHDRCEPVTNLWSKQFDIALSAMLSTATGYADYSGDVADGTQANYADLSSLGTSQYLYLGFMYPAHGIYLQVDPDYVNDSVSATVTVEYWDDANQTWTSVGTVTDGTAGGSSSLNHTGVIQWDGSQIDEGKRSISGELLPLYYYRLSWSATLPADVHVWGAAQLEKPGYDPDPFEHYSGAAEYNGRALYWPGKDYRHGMDYAAMGKHWVMNGPDAGSTKDIFGPGEVNAFARIGSYGIVSTANPYRLYLLQGKVPQQFDEYMISDVVGAVAPNTLRVVQDRIAIFATTKSVHAAVLLAPDGVYMAERVVINISQPIADYWDTSATPYIEPDYAHLSYSWVNYRRKTVHFAVPVNLQNTSATQTTLNAELVYSYLTNEWLDLYVRDKPAACGLDLIGSDDQRMAYIGDYSGYVRRTDYGDDDDGTRITHWLETSDIPVGSLLYSALLRRISLKMKTDADYGGDINVLVYPDDADTGVTPIGGGAINMGRSGYGLTSGAVECGENLRGGTFETYRIKLSSGVSVADKGAAMEIYGMALEFRKEREAQ